MKNIDWNEASECLKLLAHPHRLHMISLLLNKPYSVGDLARECGLLHNVASEHLGLMKLKGFIRSEKKGRSVYYFIEEPALSSIITCIKKRFTRD